MFAAVKRLIPRWLKRTVKSVLKPQGRAAHYDRLRGRKMVLFHLAYAGQDAFINPLLRQLRSRQTDLAIYLVVDHTFTVPLPELSTLVNLPESRILTWGARELLGPVDAFLTPTQWVFDNPGANIRICIFHGLPTKGITFLPHLLQNFNALFLLGPLQRKLYEEFAAKNPEVAAPIKTFNIGYPKSDAVINGTFSRKRTLADLGLDPAQPAVLYAPAWDKGAALDMYGEQVVERLLEVDANVLVKLHYMCYRPDGINWIERLRKFETNPRFRHVGNQPLEPLLAASDVMVNDVSSASFEFMMLDKPVVFIDCPDFFKNTLGQTQYIHSSNEVLQDIRMNAGRSAGIVVPDPSQLPAAVTRSLKHSDEFSTQRRAVRDQLLYNPGHAAAAAADTLLELIK